MRTAELESLVCGWHGAYIPLRDHLSVWICKAVLPLCRCKECQFDIACVQLPSEQHMLMRMADIGADGIAKVVENGKGGRGATQSKEKVVAKGA